MIEGRDSMSFEFRESPEYDEKETDETEQLSDKEIGLKFFLEWRRKLPKQMTI